ncbi:DUF1707 domain-containing protein [Actinomycetospora rhizophila]|uniref:DUF1707 domain-containing protein n=1 Tax=Actinomycetospora rhizophila TaxID=1416876 RepID=A0ABV9Z8G9_9PSEU
MDTDDPHTGDGRELPERPARPAGRAGLRVGDADRGAALDALGDHLAAGRLDVDEFGDRSAAAAVAVYRADLEVLFTDLPAPHPTLPDLPLPPAPRRDARAAPPVPHPGQHPDRHRDHHRPVHAPVAGLGIAILLVMLLPVMVVGAATTGTAGGLLVLPLLFVLLGHAGRPRRGRW